MPHKSPEDRKAYQKAYRQKHAERVAAVKKARYEANRDVILEQRKEYDQSEQGKATRKDYKARNKTRITKAHSEWYHKNSSKVNSKRRERYRADPEKVRLEHIAYRKRHPEASRATYKRVRTKLIKEKLQWLNEFKSSQRCLVCQLTDHDILQFHHVDESTKLDNISRMVRHGASWEILQAEISKCVIVCANDHLRLHSRSITLPEVYALCEIHLPSNC